MTTPAGSKKNSTTKWIAGASIALAAVVAAVLVLTNGGETDDRELASNADTVPTTRAADTTAPATSVVGDTATTDTTASSTSSPTVATFVYPAIGNVAFLDGLALGWWDGTTWNEMPSGYDGPVTETPLFDAQTVRYVDPAGQIVAREVSPLTEQCTEVGNQWTVGDDRATEGLVGTSGEWELRPREVVEIAADEAHLQSVRDVIAAEGAEVPEIEVQRVVRFDADGDGTDEVLISAERIDSPDTLLDEPVGNYSMVLLRRVTPTGVETIVLSSDVVTAEDRSGDFQGFIAFSRLADVADLDGDGHFEAVITTGYYEGGGVAIYSLGPTPELVVAAGCGV